MQARLSATAALSAIVEGVDVRHFAVRQDDDAIILTFADHTGRCIDLLSRPGGNRVETGDC
jgi:hypothetical protein